MRLSLPTSGRVVLFGYPAVVAVFALAGVVLADGFKWQIIIIVLYSIALVLFFVPVSRLVAVSLGLFLIVQTIASDLLSPKMKTLPSNMDRVLWVEPQKISGISGLKFINTDKEGFRVSSPVDYESDATIRIFALGASTTEQILLDNMETWTHLLQESLKSGAQVPVEVINTGAAGIRIDQIIATREAISRYHPDMLIFLVGVNDWNHHIRAARNALPKWSRLDFSESPLAHLMLSVWHGIRDSRANERLLPHPFVDFTLERMLRAQTLPLVAFSTKEVQREYQESMTELSQSCRHEDIPCLFLTQPNLYTEELSVRLQSTLWMTPPEADFRLDLPSLVSISKLYNDWLKEFSCKQQMYFLDLAAQIPKDDAYLYDDVHFTERGARAVAKILTAPAERILLKKDTRLWRCPPRP